MPQQKTVQKAKEKLRQGRAASTAAGEFVREELEHIRQGKHGAKSTKQAIAIGLSKARRAGVPLPPPKSGAKAKTRQSAEQASAVGRGERKPRSPSPRRGRAASRALRREPKAAASPRALSAQAREAAEKRGPLARAAAARKASRTKGATARRSAARKAAATHTSRS